jgi:ribosomal protein S18 acetylase RimI-like enzyme
MRIRPARVSDLDEVASIRQATIARHAPATYSELEVAELLRQVEEAGFQGMTADGWLFVAASHGTLVGTAGWAGGYLRHVHVRPGFERRGIGTRLVRHVEAEVERSTRDTEIHVNATRNAEAFDAAIGYERLPVSASVSLLFIIMRTQLGR